MLRWAERPGGYALRSGKGWHHLNNPADVPPSCRQRAGRRIPAYRGYSKILKKVTAVRRQRTAPLRWPLFAVAVLLVATSCASGPRVAPGSPEWPLALFRAAVADAQSTHSTPISVDPRLIEVSKVLAVMTSRGDSTFYLADPEATVAARMAILQEMRIAAENAFPLLDDCQGMMKLDKVTTGCPQDIKAIVVFGAPYVSEDSLCALHRVAISYASSGGMITVSEVHFVERRGHWVVDHVEEVMIIE